MFSFENSVVFVSLSGAGILCVNFILGVLETGCLQRICLQFDTTNIEALNPDVKWRITINKQNISVAETNMTCFHLQRHTWPTFQQNRSIHVNVKFASMPWTCDYLTATKRWDFVDVKHGTDNPLDGSANLQCDPTILSFIFFIHGGFFKCIFCWQWHKSQTMTKPIECSWQR